MAIRGWIIESGKCCLCLTVMTLGCSLLNGQDMSSTVVLVGIQVAALLRQQEPIDPAIRPVGALAPAEPFTPSLRLAHYLHRTYGVSRLGLLAVDTAMANMLKDPGCWDRGATSYVQRYARGFDRRMIRNTAELGAGLLTGEDLRYVPSRSTLVPARFWNAVRRAFVARMPDGRERPAFTRFTAAAVAEASTAHWIGKPLHPGWMAQSLAWGALDQVQTNLLDEFGPDFRRIGTRMWKRVRHTPDSTAPLALKR
jgi:hypothetical protein